MVLALYTSGVNAVSVPSTADKGGLCIVKHKTSFKTNTFIEIRLPFNLTQSYEERKGQFVNLVISGTLTIFCLQECKLCSGLKIIRRNIPFFFYEIPTAMTDFTAGEGSMYSNLATEDVKPGEEEARSTDRGPVTQMKMPSLFKQILLWKTYLILILTPFLLMPIPIAIPGSVRLFPVFVRTNLQLLII